MADLSLLAPAVSHLVDTLDEQGKAKVALSLLSSLVDKFDDQNKARFDTFLNWLNRLQNFDKMETDAVRNNDNVEELNEELQRILNEKSDFLNEIELKESDLRIFLKQGSFLARQLLGKTSLKEINTLIQKVDQDIFGNKTDFMDYLTSAIDKHTVPAPAC